jgi:parallel beta-helix repeat protein
VGEHPEADGIELSRTMQASLRGLSVRRTRHAVRLLDRNRNVIISDCHLYDNRGVGLFLDHVNLHQINVANSHISYNRQGGIVVRGGNVRNLQITGCDIEANMPDDGTRTEAANVWIDQSMKDCSAAEIAITGCTIQHSAHYGKTPRAPGGANIRVIGNPDFQPNMITISGNVLSDTETHLHLRHVTDVTVTGNTFFTTEPTDLLVEHCQRVVVGSCVFNPRESEETGQLVLRDSQQCVLVGLVMHRLLAGRAAVQLDRCSDCRIHACVVSQSRNGVAIVDSKNCQVEALTASGLLEGGRQVIRE